MQTICSYCETRFNVRDDLLGRSMRCPECREAFVVKAIAGTSGKLAGEDKQTAPGKPTEKKTDNQPKYETGSIADFLQVLSTEEPLDAIADSMPPDHPEEPVLLEAIEPPAAPKGKESAPTSKPESPKKSIKAKALPVQKKRSAEAESEEPKPTEIKWSPDMAPPPGRAVSPAKPPPQPDFEDASSEQAEEEEPEDETPAPRSSSRRARKVEEARPSRRERRKKKRRFVWMALLLGIIVGGVGIGGFLLLRHLQLAPQRLYDQAKKEYDAKNYEPARKLFDELAREHPKHEKAGEAKFFVELCSLRLAVGSVTVRADPAPAQAQLDKFLKATDSPEMRPFLEPGRYNLDVWDATLKLTEDLVGKGSDVFNQDAPDESEGWLQRAEAVGVVVDRFRPRETTRENVYAQIETLRKQIDGARTRTRLLAEAKERLASANDRIIDEVRTDAQKQTFFAVKKGESGKDVRLSDDPAFKQLLAEADRRIQGLVAYKRFEMPIPPSPARGGSGTGLLFAPRVDVPDPNRIPAPFGSSSVFFAAARGVLYALDDADGRVLWATRVGIDGDSLPVQLPGTDLLPELALVISNDGTQVGITARLARTGEAVWHQPLPAPVVGRPVVVGQRVFVPLSESLKGDANPDRLPELGVVLEIETANGNVIGRIVLGRPLGGNAARRPGTGQLFFPAEAKGVYVFDVERIGPDGTRVDPTFLGILSTDHEAGTLRGEPVVTMGEGDTPSYLILSLSDGLERMKLRAFPLTPADQPPAFQGAVPPPISLEGWSWFPPYCDTEKLAVVTDRGEFGLFGIRQAGNLDVPLYVLPPSPYVLPDIRTPARGQIVYADEHDFWFLARGLLHHLKIGFDAAKGIRLVPRGEPIPIGEPLQPAQINPRGTFALVVTQASASASCRATAIDLRVGRVRWQRQLGLVAQGDPIRIGDAVVMMDHDGGFYKIDAEPLSRLAGTSWLIEEKWLVARPLNEVVESSQFLAGPDGNSTYGILTLRTSQGPRIVVRRYVPGVPIEEGSAALPAPIAGNAIVLGRQVVVPLTNGLLYRLSVTAKRAIEAGPTWRGEKVSPQAVCHMAAVNDTDFVCTDGYRTLNRWRWSGEIDDFSRRGSLTLADRIAAPPVVILDGALPRLFLIDIRGNATLWDVERLTGTPTPLKAWRSGPEGVLPGGSISTGPHLLQDENDKPAIVFVADKHTVVWLNPLAAAPRWTINLKEAAGNDSFIGRPTVHDKRLYLTARTGKCLSLDLKDGAAREEPVKLRGSNVPASGVAIADDLLFLPLSDGTVLLQPTRDKPVPKAATFHLPILPLGFALPVPLDMK